MTTAAAQRFRTDLRAAWRALRRLLADPEATDQVFVITRALSGKSLLKSYNRFTATRVGQQVLAADGELLDVLQDRAALAALPPDSLGRAYLAFVEREALTADGLVEASEQGGNGLDGLPSAGMARFARRQRDMHDLWHVLTGYGRDVAGEDALLGFTYAQGGNPGLAFIAIAGAARIARARGLQAWRSLWEGYRLGRRAAWLPGQDWETLLSRPIDQLRRDLRISAPRVYPALLAAPVRPQPA